MADSPSQETSLPLFSAAYMSAPTNPSFTGPAMQEETPPPTRARPTALPVAGKDLYKYIFSKMVSQFSENYGVDRTQIPQAQIEVIRLQAQRMTVEKFNDNPTIIRERHNGRQQHRQRIQRLSLSRSPNPASHPQFLHDEPPIPHYSAMQFQGLHTECASSQDPQTRFEAMLTPAHDRKVNVLGTPIQFEMPKQLRDNQCAIRPSDLVYLRQFQDDEILRPFLDDVGKGISDLNRQNSARKKEPQSVATTYPFIQNRLVVAMNQVLLEASGLAAIAAALSTQDYSSLFVLTQSAASKLDEFLPQLQLVTRNSLASIVDPTTRRAAISKTFTGFYDCFGGLKERLCVEDRRRRRSSQEKLACTMRHTRAQVWLYLTPRDDDELLEDLDQLHDETVGTVEGTDGAAVGTGNGYGSGYAVAAASEVTPDTPMAYVPAYSG